MREIVFEVTSRFENRIRLTRSILPKIRLRHPEFRQQDYLEEIRRTVEDPTYIIRGWTNEYLCLRWCTIAPRSPKYLCAVYRELNGDGFIITAFFISEYERLLRGEVVWPQS